MPSEVTVMTDPVIVYGMIAALVGAVVLALIFARPRRGLGAATKSDAIRTSRGHAPWMPGGDIFGREPEATVAPAEPEPTFADPWPTLDQLDEQAPWERR